MPPVAPMLAKSIKEIPAGPFSYEPKWDGFRSIVFRDHDEVEIGSRNERPMTRYFPEVVEAIRANLPERAVVDGEIVVPDPELGRLEFETLQQRIHPADSRVRMLAEATPAHFIAFDLLRHRPSLVLRLGAPVQVRRPPQLPGFPARRRRGVAGEERATPAARAASADADRRR